MDMKASVGGYVRVVRWVTTWPGDLDNGDAYRCELGLVENGKGAGEVEGLDCAEGGDDAGRVSEAFVVIVLAILDVAVALLVETCAVATSDPGDTTAS